MELFVGNLYPEATQEQLKQQFQRFGTVYSVKVKNKRDADGTPIQTFAFINIDISNQTLNTCLNDFENKRDEEERIKEEEKRRVLMEKEEKYRKIKIEREERNRQKRRQRRSPDPPTLLEGGSYTARMYVSVEELRRTIGYKGEKKFEIMQMSRVTKIHTEFSYDAREEKVLGDRDTEKGENKEPTESTSVEKENPAFERHKNTLDIYGTSLERVEHAIRLINENIESKEFFVERRLQYSYVDKKYPETQARRCDREIYKVTDVKDMIKSANFKDFVVQDVLNQCFFMMHQYIKSLNGCEIKIEIARECFMSRIKKEREGIITGLEDYQRNLQIQNKLLGEITEDKGVSQHLGNRQKLGSARMKQLGIKDAFARAIKLNKSVGNPVGSRKSTTDYIGKKNTAEPKLQKKGVSNEASLIQDENSPLIQNSKPVGNTLKKKRVAGPKLQKKGVSNEASLIQDENSPSIQNSKPEKSGQHVNKDDMEEEGDDQEEEGDDNEEEGYDNEEEGDDNEEEGDDNEEEGDDNEEEGNDNEEEGDDMEEEGDESVTSDNANNIKKGKKRKKGTHVCKDDADGSYKSIEEDGEGKQLKPEVNSNPIKKTFTKSWFTQYL